MDGAGGAATVALRLAAAQGGRMLVGHKLTDNDAIHTFPHELHRGLMPHTCEAQHEIGYACHGSHRLGWNPHVRWADVLHLHNLHGGYFNPWSLSALSHARPIVWTLHDMTPITGHCAHAYDCRRWGSGCGECKRLNTYCELSSDVSADIWNWNRTIYNASFLHIVCPSEWLAEQVRESILQDHPIQVIPNGVPTHVYRPYDRDACRTECGLPIDQPIVGCAALAGAIQNRWKGGRDAIKIIEQVGCHYLNIGAISPTKHPQVMDCEHVAGEARMAKVLSCLDALLYPTHADNCPLIILEAMACGVPVVGYATGGVPELVRSGIDGLLRPTGDVAGVAADLRELLAVPSLRAVLAGNARARAVAEYDHARIAERYAAAYRDAWEAVPDGPRPLPAETITPLIDCAPFRAAEAAKAEFLAHRHRIAG